MENYEHQTHISFRAVFTQVSNGIRIYFGFEIDHYSIALFTVNFSHLHYNVIQRGCEAISG